MTTTKTGLIHTTPVNTTPVNTTPVNTTPVNTTPVNTTPVNTTPVNTTPVNTTPVNTTPVNTTPVNTTPVKTGKVATTTSTTTTKSTTSTAVAAAISATTPSIPSTAPSTAQNLREADAIRLTQAPTRQAIALISVHGDPAVAIGREAAGGQNVYVRQVGEALARLGWQVDLFTRKVNPADPDIEHHSPHCRTIRLTAGPLAPIPRDHLFPYLPEFVAAFERFYANGQYPGSYPLIHTNYWLSGWVGLQLQQSLQVQWIHTYHSLGAVKYRATATLPEVASTRLAVEQQILEQADRVIATSPWEERDLRSLVSRRGAITMIPCGTDLHRFRQRDRQQTRQQLGWDAEQPTVLYVGRFDPRKGLETLVRAMAQLSSDRLISDSLISDSLIPDSLNSHQHSSHPNHTQPWRLVLVGGSNPHQADEAERQRIATLVEALGLGDRVTFAGQIDHDRLPLYYAAANLCVVPSHYEPFGLVAIEAMACGTPVVASDVGGLRYTVRPQETGLLVPPQSVDGFATAIAQLLDRPDWAAQLGQAGASWVQEQFGWDSVATQLSRVYRACLAASLLDPAVAATLDPTNMDPVLRTRRSPRDLGLRNGRSRLGDSTAAIAS